MRLSFVSKLEELCRVDPDIYLLSADLGFRLFDDFRKKHPGRFLNTGVAEPNMIGLAAGLALSGKKVYCYSMVPFLTMRCFEQIRLDICCHDLDVKLIGGGGGLAYGLEGVTHHSIEDIAVMRSLPNMKVISPGDPLEAELCIEESFKYRGPMYVRLGRTGEPAVHGTVPDFQIGKAINVIDAGRDICIFATGNMLYKALQAARLLLKKKIGVTLFSMHTIKPVDHDLIVSCAGSFRSVFTVEEHSIVGGLGSAVSEVLAEESYGGIFRRIGIPDEFNRYVGKNEFLLDKYGLSAGKIAEKMEWVLREQPGLPGAYEKPAVYSGDKQDGKNNIS